ncbi:MAG: hypothetical protein JWQ79_3291 [Mucilaginibacter sp.]|nr:hypothetical protein [Mucilaginibacter sp.]
MELTDAQVLEQLKYRKLRLQLEMENVDRAIKAFTNITEIDPLDAAIYMDEEIVIDDDFGMALLSYNPKMSAQKKVLYALGRIKKGNARDIVDYIIRVDGHIKDTRKLSDRITWIASRMYKQGAIDAERIGRKNVYKPKGS